MKVVRKGVDFVAADGEGADCKLEELEGVGGELGLEVGDLRRVNGKDPPPRRGAIAGLLTRDGNEIGLLDVGPYLLQR